MSDWRYLVQRIDNGTPGEFIHTELPLRDATLTEMLNGPMSLTGTLAPRIGSLIADDGLPLLQKWGSLVWAEEDGVIRGGGIVVASDFTGPEWQIECMGLAGYPNKTPYTGSKLFVHKDPIADILLHIWQHLHSFDDFNFGITLVDPDGNPPKSPVRIGVALSQAEFDTQNGPLSFESGPYRLSWYETPDLGAAITDLASSTPFEFRERHDWNAARTAIAHRIVVGYPVLGRRRTDLRFVYGENVVSQPPLNDDGDSYANELLVLGNGEGRLKKHATVQRKDGRMRVARLYTDEVITSDTWAADRGRRQLALRAGRLTTTSITVRDHEYAPLGAWSVGDEILVQVDNDWTSQAFWVRVLSTRMKPDNLEVAELTVQRTDVAVNS